MCGRFKSNLDAQLGLLTVFLHGRMKTQSPAVAAMGDHPNGRWNTAHEKRVMDKGEEKLHI